MDQSKGSQFVLICCGRGDRLLAHNLWGNWILMQRERELLTLSPLSFPTCVSLFRKIEFPLARCHDSIREIPFQTHFGSSLLLSVGSLLLSKLVRYHCRPCLVLSFRIGRMCFIAIIIHSPNTRTPSVIM